MELADLRNIPIFSEIEKMNNYFENKYLNLENGER